jgi:hypothetical protein
MRVTLLALSTGSLPEWFAWRGRYLCCRKYSRYGGETEMFKTVAMENSTWAVVRTDPAKPRMMEVVATFFDEERAREYADLQNGEPAGQAAAAQAEPAPAPVARKRAAAPAKRAPAKVNGAHTEVDLSQRQSAVLRAMREKADENNEVAVKAAVLASAAQIPLGSLHSVLGSLEKKKLVQLTKAGSARSPAVYQML